MLLFKILKQDKQSPQKQLKDCFIRNEIKTTTKKMIINYIFTPFFLQMKSNKND